MKLLVLGAGGVGGYFGARLVEAQADVTFLVRQARKDKLTKEGLRVLSPRGNAHIRAHLITDATFGGPYDLVLLTCKAYDLDSAMTAIRPAMTRGATVVPLLNGMRHFAQLDAAFGAQNVAGGTAQVATTIREDGTLVHSSQFASMLFGERVAGQAPRKGLVDLAAWTERSGIDGGLHSNITQALWDKWVMLCTLAASTASLRASVGEIVATRYGRDVMLAMFDECRQVAAAAGHEPDATMQEKAKALLTQQGSTFHASLLADVLKGGPIEADHIVGDMVSRANAANIAVPNLRYALTGLQIYENLRSGARK
jgi:2-dehydropantoate 2-reductase